MSHLPFFSVVIIGIICTFCTCKKDNPCPTCPPPQVSSVSLSAEDIQCQEVWLKLKFSDNNNPRGFALLRDGAQVASGSLVTSDTLLIDTTVVAGHTYAYTAQRLNGSTAFDSSPQLQVRTLDSTSHTINWIVDTLGALGLIRDVWVFSKDNAWAVGEIYLNDSTGQVDMNRRYNAARWNGIEWQLFQVPTESFGGSFGHAVLYTIFAFDTNSVWTFSDAGSYCKWNGISWESHYVPERSGGGNRLWGTSPNNLFLVGTNGSISKFNGSTWTKMTSSTTVDLQDIYGLDANHIWATGTNNDYNGSVILSFDGTVWKKLYEGNSFGFSSVWINKGRRLFVAGDSGPWKYDLDNQSFISIPTPSQYIMYCVRATDVNDVFFSGQNSEITHYNGTSYRLFIDVQSMINADTWWYSIKPSGNFVVAGGGYYMGYNFAPIVARGYR